MTLTYRVSEQWVRCDCIFVGFYLLFYFTYIKTYATMQAYKTNFISGCLLFIEVFHIIIECKILLCEITLKICLLVARA